MSSSRRKAVDGWMRRLSSHAFRGSCRINNRDCLRPTTSRSPRRELRRFTRHMRNRITKVRPPSHASRVAVCYQLTTSFRCRTFSRQPPAKPVTSPSLPLWPNEEQSDRYSRVDDGSRSPSLRPSTGFRQPGRTCSTAWARGTADRDRRHVRCVASTNPTIKARYAPAST